MATIVVLRNKATGKTQSMYSVDARYALNGPNKDNWEFVRRLGRTAKLVEPGIAVDNVPGAESGAVEFHGDAVLQKDAARILSSPKKDVLDEESPAEKETPQAPRGSRGGGKQEPAKADADDK